MVSDPESPFCRLIYGNHEKLFAANINLTNLHLDTLSSYAPDQVKVKLIKKPPPHGMVAVKGSNLLRDQDSIILIQLYPEFPETGSGRPVVAVLPSDPHWFDLFEKDIMKMWEGCE